MKKSFCVFSLVFSFLINVGNAQNIPRTEKDIPVFPGAVPKPEEQKQSIKDYQEIFAGESIRDLCISVYSVKSIPDEICRFYIEKLAATEGFPEDDSENENSASNIKPWYEVSYFPNSWFEDQYDGNLKIHDGKWFKVALSERKQWKSGEWLQGAYFEWTVLLSNGDLARLSVDLIDDNSFDSRAKKVSNKTSITIMSRIETLSEDDQ